MPFRKKPGKLLILLATAFLIYGCVTFKTNQSGAPIEEEKVKTIIAGQTTKEEILKIFGEPTEIKKQDAEETLVYSSKELKTPVYLGGLIENKARIKAKNMTLTITIEDSVVTRFKFQSIEE